MIHVVFYDPSTGKVNGSATVRDTAAMEAKFLAANPNAVQVSEPVISAAQLTGAAVNPVTKVLTGPGLGSITTLATGPAPLTGQS